MQCKSSWRKRHLGFLVASRVCSVLAPSHYIATSTRTKPIDTIHMWGTYMHKCTHNTKTHTTHMHGHAQRHTHLCKIPTIILPKMLMEHTHHRIYTASLQHSIYTPHNVLTDNYVCTTSMPCTDAHMANTLMESCTWTLAGMAFCISEHSHACLEKKCWESIALKELTEDRITEMSIKETFLAYCQLRLFYFQVANTE